MSGGARHWASGFGLAAGILALLPTVARADLGAPCRMIGDEAGYVAALEAAGWSPIPEAETAARDNAVRAGSEILVGSLFMPRIDNATGYDLFIEQAHGETRRLLERGSVTLFARDDAQAVLSYELFNGTITVLCFFPGTDLPEVAERLAGRVPDPAAFSPNILHTAEKAEVDGHEVVTGWWEFRRPEGAEAVPLAPFAVFVFTTFPEQAGK